MKGSASLVSSLKAVWIVAILVAPAVLTSPVQARFAKVDQPFLDREIPRVEAMGDSLAGIRNPVDMLMAVGMLLDERREALGRLQEDLPLTDLDGIETADRYDEAVVTVLGRVVRTAAVDTSAIPPKVASRFDAAVKSLPDMGQFPLPFMILRAAETMVRTADGLDEEVKASPASVARAALAHIREWTDTYRQVQEDIFKTSQAEGLRESAVLMRMHCQKDGSPLDLTGMKDRISADGTVTSLYYVECPVCHEVQVIEYPARMATRLNQAGIRQRLKTPPNLARSRREPEL